ncbi:MAG TPA: TlpA disulfide reductase family protein [Acidimicrobiales bacterium]|nr:TlpA disulfide reductase family protein [Acidimicrobiales bacterium]
MAVLLLALAACNSSDTPRAEVGERAPTFTSVDLDGKQVRLEDFRGRVVLLNFWASWCGPCTEEFPRLKAAHGDDVVVLGVVFDDSAEAARDFVRKQGATWASVVDPDHQIADAYGVAKKPGIPVTWLVDRDGVARARHLGLLKEADVEALVGATR